MFYSNQYASYDNGLFRILNFVPAGTAWFRFVKPTDGVTECGIYAGEDLEPGTEFTRTDFIGPEICDHISAAIEQNLMLDPESPDHRPSAFAHQYPWSKPKTTTPDGRSFNRGNMQRGQKKNSGRW